MLYKNVGIITALAAAFILVGTPVQAELSLISKSVCEGCGCKYEKECDYLSCSISCTCQSGDQNDCYEKKAGGSNVTVTKLPTNMTRYHVHEAVPPAAKQ
jgi:hypothetical protein